MTRYDGEITRQGNRVWRQCARCGAPMPPDTIRRACRDCWDTDRTILRKQNTA